MSEAAGAFRGLELARVFRPWTPPCWLLAVLLIEPVAVAAATATNPWRGWVFGGAGIAELTGSGTWLRAPGYWAHAGYGNAAFGAGFVLIAWCGWTAPPAFRRQELAFLVAAVIPTVDNLAYMLGGSNEQVDPTPFCLAATGAVMAYALVKGDLIIYSPVARALIVDQIGDAVMVVNPVGRTRDPNAAGVHLVRAMRPAAPPDLAGLSCEVLSGRVTGAGEAQFA
ncbi:MAG: hypothetical protein H7269_07155, partial [Cellulomonas sp.]|nr:hypothetical protein [Cellulomonas sp.]